MTRTWLALFAALLAGCAVMEPPQGYVLVEPGDDSVFAAVSSAGNRIAVKRHENPEGGTLEFWTEAVRRELVDGRGYRLVESKEIKTESGLSGRELLFAVEKESGAFAYLVAVFLREGGLLRKTRILVAEAGGESRAFHEDLAKVRAALATLR